MTRPFFSLLAVFLVLGEVCFIIKWNRGNYYDDILYRLVPVFYYCLQPAFIYLLICLVLILFYYLLPFYDYYFNKFQFCCRFLVLFIPYLKILVLDLYMMLTLRQVLWNEFVSCIQINKKYILKKYIDCMYCLFYYYSWRD